MNEKQFDNLDLSECQEKKIKDIRLKTTFNLNLAFGKKMQGYSLTPLEWAKEIILICEDPTFVIGRTEKYYNCTLPIEVQKVLIRELIDQCERKNLNEWLLDDLRTFAELEVFGRQAEPGHMAAAASILEAGGFLDVGTWSKQRMKYAIVAMAEALIEKYELSTDLYALSAELARKFGTNLPESTFGTAKNGQDYQTLKTEFKDQLS